MSTQIQFTFTSEAPYSDEELAELKDGMTDFVIEGDEDVIKDSCELIVVQPGNESEVELVQRLLKKFSMEVSVRVLDEDAETVSTTTISNYDES